MSEENTPKKSLSSKVLIRKYKSLPLKSKVKCFIQIFISLLCVLGLIYYSWLLISQYYKGQTVVNFEIETIPKDHKIPGITICLPELVSMERMAQKYEEFQPIYEKYLKFIENNSEDDSNEELKNNNRKEMSQYWDSMTTIVDKSGPTVTELFNLSIPYLKEGNNSSYPIEVEVVGHLRNGNEFSNKRTVIDSQPIETMVFQQNGEMKKCFTFFSQLHKKWRDYHMDITKIDIYIEQNEKHYPRNNYLDKNIKFALHSSNTLPQNLRINNFIEVTANHKIEITYSRWKTVLLGSNYKTNCLHYDLDDRFGYRFRSDCINDCIRENLDDCSIRKEKQMNSTFKRCLFPTDALLGRHVFTKQEMDFKLCKSHKNYECLELIMGGLEVQCQNPCRPECVNRYYMYEIKKSIKAFNNLTMIKIVHDQFPDQITEHLPETTLIDFISNFGGLIGMWLGLSALAILKYVIKFF